MSESKGPALPVISTGESEINKSRRVEDDQGGLNKEKVKKMTKREHKLHMEQLKEDLKAKTHKGYIPRDIFAEDEERRRKEQELAKEK
mmetsp:Transcript_10479/g.11760  ORF Transcript_10479/g.11760 Transcript_10479/m.11760 type:complete len:88 (+) Transcript_10479:147-410(+)